MPDSKIAVSWADLLLITLISGLGAGAWLAAGAAVQRWTAEGAPSERAQADSLGVHRLERALEVAEGNRSFADERARELRLERMRHETALRLALAQRPPAAAEVERLERSLQADSVLAFLLEQQVQQQDSVAAARRDALEQARGEAGRRYRARSAAFGLQRTAWTAATAVLVVGLLVGICALLLRVRSGDLPRVRRSVVLGSASLIIALMFTHQVAGAIGLVGLVSLGATIILFWKLLRGPT